jgi:TDG/mug DNA glycosylase family protein
VDRPTVDIYEHGADRWVERREPISLDEARAFGRSMIGQGPVADLGCGPGWYAAVMPEPTIALDAARSMLDHTATTAPAALRVQADLEALPLRRGALGGAWARNSYVHVPQHRMPMALADLHRALQLDASFALQVLPGDREGDFGDDDFPGRFFSLWDRDRLGDVLIGAGFEVTSLEQHDLDQTKRFDAVIRARLQRAHRLPDTVGPEMRLLVCGLNPSIYSADAGEHYARPGNRFWPAALAAGLVSRDHDSRAALADHSVGMTNLVARASVAAAELTRDEFVDGLARVERLCAWLRPRAVCFVGLQGWRAAVDRKATAGVQDRDLGGVPVYVMPSTSGLNAHSQLPALADHLRAASALADARR